MDELKTLESLGFSLGIHANYAFRLNGQSLHDAIYEGHSLLHRQRSDDEIHALDRMAALEEPLQASVYNGGATRLTGVGLFC